MGVKNGWLIKEGHWRRTWKSRWFVLTSNYLYYYETDDIGDRRCGTWVEPIRRINLLGASVSPVKRNRSQCAYAFRLDTPCDEHAHAYKLGSPTSPKDSDEWTRSLQQTIDALNNQVGLKGKSLLFTPVMPNFVSNVMQYWPENPIKQGWLVKQGHFVKSWKRRWFILSTDNLYYFHNKNIGDPRLGRFQEPIVRICLENATISKPAEMIKHRPHTFLLETPHDEHASHYFMDGGSDACSVEWAIAIGDVIYNLLPAEMRSRKDSIPENANVSNGVFQLSLTTGVDLGSIGK